MIKFQIIICILYMYVYTYVLNSFNERCYIFPVQGRWLHCPCQIASPTEKAKMGYYKVGNESILYTSMPLVDNHKGMKDSLSVLSLIHFTKKSIRYTRGFLAKGPSQTSSYFSLPPPHSPRSLVHMPRPLVNHPPSCSFTFCLMVGSRCEQVCGRRDSHFLG